MNYRERPNTTRLKVASVFLMRGRLTYVSRRTQSVPHGGRWQNPGGKLTHGETAAQAAVRELREETGLTIGPERLEVLCDTEVELDDGRQCRVRTFIVELRDGEEPAALEPEKSGAWILRSPWALAGIPERLTPALPETLRILMARMS